MADITNCPYCNHQFDAAKTGYDENIPCPNCSGLLDIAKDANIILDTPFGDIGITFLNSKPLSLLKLLKNFIKR